MAKSKFEYVKRFELDDELLPDTYIVVRIDGRGFSRFTDAHAYLKPNDARGLALMNQAAADVMADWNDVILAFGESDEYSFVFPRRCNVFSRRSAKIATGMSSLFAAAFVMHWPTFFPDVKLRYPPAFDARCVCYPSLRTITDYCKWRQVDTHVNTMYNECFWALVNKGGHTPEGAHAALKGTFSNQKNELLFSTFGINYAKLPIMYRRGTTLLRTSALPRADAPADKKKTRGGGGRGGGAAASGRAGVPSSDAAAPHVAAAPPATDASTTSESSLCVALDRVSLCAGTAAAGDEPSRTSDAAAAAAAAEPWSVYPHVSGVEHPAVRLPASVVMLFPDYNKDSILTDVFSACEE